MSKEVSRDEVRMQELFDAAHRDRSLKVELLSDPQAVGERYGVKFTREETERLQKLGAFMEMADEAKVGTLFRRCDPRVCYTSTVWLQQEVIELVTVFVHPKDPIFYPVEMVRQRFAPFGRITPAMER